MPYAIPYNSATLRKSNSFVIVLNIRGVEMTNFLDIIHRLSLIKDTRRFGDWSLPPSSGKKDTYSFGPNR
jgi:hypothetical protein